MSTEMAGVLLAILGLVLGLVLSRLARKYFPGLGQRKRGAAPPVLSNRQQMRKHARETDKQIRRRSTPSDGKR